MEKATLQLKKSCDVCSHSFVCSYRKEITEFLTKMGKSYLYSGSSNFGSLLYQLSVTKCNHFEPRSKHYIVLHNITYNVCKQLFNAANSEGFEISRTIGECNIKCPDGETYELKDFIDNIDLELE